MKINRRTFVFVLPVLAAFTACDRQMRGMLSPEEDDLTKSISLIQEGSVAHFLSQRKMNPIFNSQTEWNFGSGYLFLTALAFFGVGNYHYQINGSYVQYPINMVIFNYNNQRLSIIKDGQEIWTYEPQHQTHYIPYQGG